jgi:hypothetical protein
MAGLLARDAKRLDGIAGADHQLLGAGSFAQLDGNGISVIEGREIVSKSGECFRCHGASFHAASAEEHSFME